MPPSGCRLSLQAWSKALVPRLSESRCSLVSPRPRWLPTLGTRPEPGSQVLTYPADSSDSKRCCSYV